MIRPCLLSQALPVKLAVFLSMMGTVPLFAQEKSGVPQVIAPPESFFEKFRDREHVDWRFQR